MNQHGKVSIALISILTAVGLVISVGLIILVMYFSISNQEISLRNQAVAQQKANEVIFDKVWKTIQQVAQVADQSKEAFKEIYFGIMQERYDGEAKGAPLFKWIQEQNPTFSLELYSKLADAIEANRAEFARVQNRLIDIKREHENLRKMFPGSLFISGRQELDIKIVTSIKTEEAFRTGKDDDVSLPMSKK